MGSSRGTVKVTTSRWLVDSSTPGTTPPAASPSPAWSGRTPGTGLVTSAQ